MIIYKHTSPSGKSYVGKTVDSISKRFRDHVRNSEKYLNTNSKFQNAIRKYGPENFQSEILEEVNDNNWKEREIYWINYYDSLNNGYNMTPGGDGLPSGELHPNYGKTGKDNYNFGKKHSNEVNKSKGRTGEENGMFGVLGEDHHLHNIPRTDEVKEKISKTLMGHIVSEDTKTKISKTKIGELNPNYGKIWVKNVNTNQCILINKNLLESYVTDGWCRGTLRLQRDKNNPNAKIIYIFDDNNNIMFKCNGNFKNICKENNLPTSALNTSYKNGGEKIYPINMHNRNKLFAKKKGWYKYKGWYATQYETKGAANINLGMIKEPN